MTYHIHVSIDSLLGMAGPEFAELCDRTFTGENGKPLSADELRPLLMQMKAEGVNLIQPSGCDNFDAVNEGCRGHDGRKLEN
jgi:hypothetical protein